MKIYPDIKTYLEDKPPQVFKDEMNPLIAMKRPIIVLEDHETPPDIPKLLIPVQKEKGIYEIGFPLITLAEWDSENPLISKTPLTCQQKNGENYTLKIREEVLDATQLNDTDTYHRLSLREDLSDRCDRKTATTIAVLVGLFEGIRDHKRTKVQFPLLKLPHCLQKLSSDEVNQPLVVSLDRRYKLRHNLEILTSKLRSQLNRKAEMMPIGRIQEMDAYCLRDYVRRPGRNAIEKAGARQELLGIERYQNFNTPENRFLKGFCELLHLECEQYNHYPEAKSLGLVINSFYQDPAVKTIQKASALLGKPNYVLEQNPIYRSFYQAYLDWVHRRHDKEKIWTFRRQLAADAITVLLMVSLLSLQNSYVEAWAKFTIRDIPLYGHYLDDQVLPRIECFLKNQVFSFKIERASQINQGDWLLTIEQQNINNLNRQCWQIPIWVFWYQPPLEILEAISQNSNNSWCFYLDEPPKKEQKSQEINNLKVVRVPIDQGWQNVLKLLTAQILTYVEELRS